MSKIRAQFANLAAGSTIRAELNGMLPFSVSATLTAAAAATPVHIVPVASVPAGMSAYVTDVLLVVNGATPWTDITATLVKVQDTAGSPVVGITVGKAALLANAKIGKENAACVLAAPVLLGTGFTAANGLDIVADANFAAGSDIVATVTGYIA